MKQFTLSGLLMLLTLSLTAQAQEPWISLYTNTIELDATTEVNTQTIPLKLNKDISIKDVEIENGKPIYIRLGKSYDKTYQDAVTISLIKDAVPSLQIVTKINLLKKSGVYEGLLSFADNKDKKQEVSFTLNRPAAKLEGPQILKLNIVGGEVTLSDPLVLKESGKLSNITGLQLQAPWFAGINSNSVFDFVKMPKVNAGQPAQVEYRPVTAVLGKFPLGKTSGKFEINAPELADPLLVDVEILRKESVWWLWGTIILGILSGVLLRHYLKDRKELEEKKIEGDELLLKIQGEISGIEDPEFNKEVRALMEPLNNALKEKSTPFSIKKGKLADLDKLIQALMTGYEQKKNDFNALVKGAADKLMALSVIFENNGLAAGIKVGIGNAAQSYTKAKESLLKKNFTIASQEINWVVTGLNKFIEKYTKPVSDTILLVETDKILPGIITQPLKDALKKKSTEIKEALPGVKQGTDDMSQLVNSINAADSIQLNYYGMVQLLKENTESLFRKDHNDDDTPLMKDFQKVFTEWQTNLQAVLDDPRTEISTIKLGELDSVWTNVKATCIAGGQRMRDAKEVAPLAPLTFPWQRAKEFLNGASIITTGVGTNTIAFRTRIARRNWFWVTFFQTLFVFLLITIIVYKLYAPTFIGTWDEIIALFLFAFGLDVTIDNVLLLRDRKP
jgi:hypothetical protein